MAATLLVAGCGSDDEPSGSSSQANGQASGSTTVGNVVTNEDGDTTVIQPEVVTGAEASSVWRAARGACADSSIEAVYARYLAAIKRRGAEKAQVAPGIVEQAKRLPRRARGTVAAAPTAATLYAVSRPRAERSAAFRGCLRGLQSTVDDR